jgi:hypothetical protein
VVKHSIGPKQVPYIVTHDARTIRYPDPHIKVSKIYFKYKLLGEGNDRKLAKS